MPAPLTTALLVYPFALLLCFLLYWAGSRRSYLRRRPTAPGDPALFDWHFFVPCRDEEAVVGTTVARLRAGFPGADVWVIDDDSDDATGEIAAALAADDRGCISSAAAARTPGPERGPRSTPRTNGSGNSSRRAPTAPG